MKIYSAENNDSLEEIRKYNGKIVILGAGIVGRYVLGVCVLNDLQVMCFCDNAMQMQGEIIEGKEVRSIAHLNDKEEYAFIIATADVQHIILQINCFHNAKYWLGGELLEGEDFADCSFEERYRLKCCVLNHRQYSRDNYFFVNNIDLMITERCSLRCKECCNLMQYYKNPQNFCKKDLFRELDRLDEIFDVVNELRIIGGEPFMNPDIYDIIKYASGKRSVQYIIVYTNGTIPLQDSGIQSFQDDKVLLNITRYKNHDKNIDFLVNQCKVNGIHFRIGDSGKWTECSSLNRHNRQEHALVKTFEECCVNNVTTVLDGKIFMCAFAANLYGLRAVPKNVNEYIALEEEENIDILRKQVREFLTKTTYLKACDYCNGRPIYQEGKLEPAVQSDRPLEYVQYV